MKYLSLFTALSSVIFLLACGPNGSGGGAVSPQNTNSTVQGTLNRLNATPPTGPFKVHFDKVEAANLFSLQLMIACVSGFPCPSFPPTVNIDGPGNLTPQSGSPISALFLSASFAENIAGGSACYRAAQTALAQGKQLDISGDGTIYPLEYCTGGWNGTGAVSSGVLMGTSSNSSAGTTPAVIAPGPCFLAGSTTTTATMTLPPVPSFMTLDVRIVFSSITSCSVGAASPPAPSPTPWPTPGPFPVPTPIPGTLPPVIHP